MKNLILNNPILKKMWNQSILFIIVFIFFYLFAILFIYLFIILFLIFLYYLYLILLVLFYFTNHSWCIDFIRNNLVKINFVFVRRFIVNFTLLIL